MSEGNEVLSQEEINALMDGNIEQAEGNKLSAQEKDILGEVGNIAMGSAATALYSLLNQKVSITAPEVDIISFNELSEEYDRPCLLVTVEYKKGLEGVNLLIINDKDARIIADLMMGGDGSKLDSELSDIHLSAIGEAMNQMMGSSSTAMSSIMDKVINISPPELDYLEIDDVIDDEEKFFNNQEKVVSISFQLKIGDLIDSSFKQIAPIKFTKELVNKLTKKESGLAAKEETRQKKETASEEKKAKTNTEAEKVSTAKNISTAKKVSKSDNNQQEVDVKSAQFPSFDREDEEVVPRNMELIKDVPLQVTVRLGKTRMTIREILDLGEGSIVELDKLAGEPVDLLINGKLVAKGEVVVIDDNFAFRVKDIINPLDRLNKI